ncbi:MULTISPECIES: dicarboxylate/amino acid:cation symporter [unclassified Sedimentibacter]|uniref:dicarboxylate/amino acid:cation symporter n=1 Tax=unclassified Sedimentibacter TaxID=2649220 RepID=UPI0027DFECBD|nr:dicarboxylate/amino acid:cation symporter [Sedimentibacter sp. MB35-C1]WMJ79033.1 dicarboxylate/amino acid:cation symporter [Sedimentibacter sp. MB35-C1]
MQLTTKIFIGLALGILAGIIFQSNPEIAKSYIKPFGTLFLNLIKLSIVPLVFSSLVVGACSMDDVRKLGRIGGKTVAFYMLTTAFAVTIGLILANISNVGGDFSIPADLEFEISAAPSITETLLNIIPSNPLNALVEGKMLQIIAFALIIGAGIIGIGEKGKILFNFFDAFAEVMYKIIGKIMEFAPIGVFALITPVVAENGPAVLLPLLKLIIAVYIGCALHALLTYSSVVSIFAKISPLKFFKGAAPAMMFSYSTASSSGTLPITMKSVEENLGVSKSISSFVLPLGATINMDGTAIYQGICAIFIANIYGLDLSISAQLTIILTATLASIGTAGVPGAGMIMLGMVLQSVGLPIEGVALIAGVDRILDMMRTMINVTGDAACSVVIASTEGELNKEVVASK